MVWILVDFPYLSHKNCDLLCNNTRNPPVRVKLFLWELSPLPEFPRKSVNTPSGSLQSAELRLFINLLLSLKSSLRLNMKIGSGNFSWASLEKEMKHERNPLVELGPGMIHLWELFLGQCWPRLTPTTLPSGLTSAQPEQVGSHLEIWVRFSWNRNREEKTNTK